MKEEIIFEDFLKVDIVMMKYLSRFKKITFSISLIILNWILFVLFTHNHNNILYFVPLLILFFHNNFQGSDRNDLGLQSCLKVLLF